MSTTCCFLRGRIEGLKIAVADGRCITNRDPNSFTEEMRIKIAETKRLNTLLNSEKVTLKPSGYLEYTRGENKGKTQHRVVMEKHLGRKLGGNEYVHHINHIKTDNRLENLEVMDKCLHSSLHAKVNYLTRTRLADGRFA